MENPNPQNFICPVHKTALLEGEKECWRCRTRGVVILNMEDEDRRLKRLSHGEAHFIEIKKIPVWIGMN